MKYDNREKIYFYVVLSENFLYHLIECFRMIFRHFANKSWNLFRVHRTVQAENTSLRDKTLIRCYGAAHGSTEILSWPHSSKFKMISSLNKPVQSLQSVALQFDTAPNRMSSPPSGKFQVEHAAKNV